MIVIYYYYYYYYYLGRYQQLEVLPVLLLGITTIYIYPPYIYLQTPHWHDALKFKLEIKDGLSRQPWNKNN